ncbi:MAG TPA: 2,3-bisphosphoglycerate-independent phosphoglycerate mutase [Chthoniobacterales bacterium]|jgi:2,3-bisphosphoglycerate-independent phosphoglycerate mutase
MAKPVVLIIRDGWGINPGGKATAERDGNATLLAHTPFHDQLYATYPSSTLSACGLDVGLPPGQMGNSEVGHLNLGAGRVVYQDFTRINLAIEQGELARNPVLLEALAKAKSTRLHLIGLVSDGGVHSHQDHLIALTKIAAANGVTDTMIHAITDGRDTSPTGGADYLATVENGIAGTGAQIATVIGRYFAMDRDQRWDRNKLAWDAIVLGRGSVTDKTPSDAVRFLYATEPRGDEFLPPTIFSHPNEPRIRDGDVVLWFNFRSDRTRQLSEAFLYPDFHSFEREVHPQIHYVTLTQYDKKYQVPVIFGPQTLDNILGKVVSDAGRTQLRIAETEKYPHVTYFFNGGVETAYPGEDRMIVPSPKVATYDLQPEMNATQVTTELLAVIDRYDMVILNFANPDMVGHTGVVEAAVRSVETIDHCVRLVTEKVLALGGKLLITADHGNCEVMRNPDGSPNTAHTIFPVHFIYVAADHASVQMEHGILADVSPTLLALLGVPQPKEMTGHSLVEYLS